MKIGVVGLGYVGSALLNGMKDSHNIFSYDKFKESTEKNIDNLIEKVDIVFICVPTPMKKDGSCNRSIVEDVLSQIDKCDKKTLITVLKSTLEIGSTEYFENKYSNLNLVFNPEFLTEANFKEDFENQDRIIIGGDNIDLIYNIYLETFKDVKIITTDCKTAEMVKYVTNAFLATKVSFANEISSFCSKLNMDYERIIDIAKLDQRLGNSHWKVPGPDGKKGYGGSCFPKDIASLINQFENNKIESIILKSSFNRNNNIDRPDKDWQKLKGKFVSDE